MLHLDRSQDVAELCKHAVRTLSHSIQQQSDPALTVQRTLAHVGVLADAEQKSRQEVVAERVYGVTVVEVVE